MNQSIYVELDAVSQEWVLNAWGTTVTKKNILGLIIGPYINYIPKSGLKAFGRKINSPDYVKFEILSKLNGKDLRQGIYVPDECHHVIEIAIKDTMRREFELFMNYSSYFSSQCIHNQIRMFIEINQIPGDKLDLEYFKKLYYNRRKRIKSPEKFPISRSLQIV